MQTLDLAKLQSHTAEEIDVLIKQLELGMTDVLKVEKNIPKAIKLRELIGACIDVYQMKKFGKLIC